MDRHTSENIINLAQIIRTQAHLNSTDIFLRTMELSRPWDRHNPRLLGQ